MGHDGRQCSVCPKPGWRLALLGIVSCLGCGTSVLVEGEPDPDTPPVVQPGIAPAGPIVCAAAQLPMHCGFAMHPLAEEFLEDECPVFCGCEMSVIGPVGDDPTAIEQCLCDSAASGFAAYAKIHIGAAVGSFVTHRLLRPGPDGGTVEWIHEEATNEATSTALTQCEGVTCSDGSLEGEDCTTTPLQ
jgi:hypothetical protein